MIDVGLNTVTDYISFGIKLAEILKLLHKNSIIHFDLKPDNILYLKDGTLRLIDFGVSLFKGEIAQSYGT